MNNRQTLSRIGGLLAVIAYLSLLWRESCEHPAVFCYRIGCSLMQGRRATGANPGNPQAQGQCSSHSNSFSTFSTTSRG